jgi:hypothetical protein
MIRQRLERPAIDTKNPGVSEMGIAREIKHAGVLSANADAVDLAANVTSGNSFDGSIVPAPCSLLRRPIRSLAGISGRQGTWN